MPDALRDGFFGKQLLMVLSNILRYQLIPDAVLRLREESRSSDTRPKTAANNSTESQDRTIINRFVGWAIWNLIGLEKSNDFEEKSERLKLLRQMRVFEHEILGNDEYINLYYSTSDMLINNGFLTLVHPRYADFAFRLISNLQEAISFDMIKQNGGHFAKRTRSIIQSQLKCTLWPCFDNLTVGLNIPEEICREVLDRVVTKTTNAWVGSHIKRYRSRTIGRGAKKENSVALRPKLKSIDKQKGGSTNLKAPKRQKTKK